MTAEKPTEPAAAAPTPEPTPTFTSSPEFLAAVTKATAEAIGPAVAAAVSGVRSDMAMEFAKMLAGARGPTGDPTMDISSIMSELSLNIAAMTNTGDNRKPMPPEEVRRRVQAAERMGKIVIRINEEGLQPHYTIVAQTWLSNQLIQPWLPNGDGQWRSNEVIWTGAPNAAMRPMNEIAQEVFDAYLESVGGSTKNEGTAREQAVWTGYGGLIMVGDNPPQSMVQRGNVRGAQPATAGAGLETTSVLTSTDNPNAKRIPILGTVTAPAEVTAPGSLPSVSIQR